ncbi:hypothetical protein LCGC14_2880680, partial [marine sediment metagenome]
KRVAVEGVASSRAAQLRGARPFDIETEQVPTAAEGARLGTRTRNFIRADLDLAATIIENAKTDPQQMAVVPGVETPGRSLRLVREILGEDGIVSVHKRSDGLFDVLVGDKGSPLNTNANKQQFAREGFFEGMELIVDGKPMQYVGESKEPGRINVSRPGQPGFTQVAREDARRAPSVKGIRPVLREVDVRFPAENKRAFRFDTEGHIFEVGILESSDGKKLAITSIAEVVGKDLRLRSLSDLSPSGTVGVGVLRSLLRQLRERFPKAERVAGQRSTARAAASQFRLSPLIDIELPGPRPFIAPRPQGFVELEGKTGPVSILADVLSPEEFKTFVKLGEKLFPEGVDKPEGFLENNAASNNMVVGRSNSGAFIIGDNLTGEVLFRAKTFNEA